MLRRLTGWVGELLVTLGILLLLFAAWQLWWTDVVSARESARVVQQVRDDFARGASDPADPSAPSDPAGPSIPGGERAPVPPDGAFALMAVPRFGPHWVQPVLRGTGLSVLANGVGHYDGTAMPGEVGNFAVAGHRTTHGRPFHDIDSLREGDRIVVDTLETEYVYAVRDHEVVRPTDVAVIAPVPDAPGATPVDRVMTLTSCNPQYSATQRYVVHAVLVSSRPRDPPAGGPGSR